MYYTCTFNAEETDRVLKIGIHPENKIQINKGFNWFSLNQIYLDKTRQNPFMGRFCLIGSQWWFGLYKFTIYCNLINTCITFNTRHFTIILLKKKSAYLGKYFSHCVNFWCLLFFRFQHFTGEGHQSLFHLNLVEWVPLVKALSSKQLAGHQHSLYDAQTKCNSSDHLGLSGDFLQELCRNLFKGGHNCWGRKVIKKILEREKRDDIRNKRRSRVRQDHL